MTEAPTLFDAAEGERRRDEAIARVARHAADPWQAAAYDAIHWCAVTMEDFTTDDVWERLHRQGITGPHEPRALGAVMRRAVADGMIRAADKMPRPSQRPETHRNPKRVWERAR